MSNNALNMKYKYYFACIKTRVI